ncbi:MAG: hypothetical protein FWF43_04620 [Propionibacteriaceae bacterium]|nr:hypothetical protein [Propionibacteriaceae bacterium]
MTQPPYGDNAYTPPPQYPGQAPSPQMPAAPSYPPATYQQGYGAPVAPGYSSEQPKQKSGRLGIIAFVIVLVTGILFVVSMHGIMVGLANAFGAGWMRTGTTPDLSTLSDQQLSDLQQPAWLFLVSMAAGVVGFILSIVAAATKRGRLMGILGIVAGILAPIMAMVVAMAMAN